MTEQHYSGLTGIKKSGEKTLLRGEGNKAGRIAKFSYTFCYKQ